MVSFSLDLRMFSVSTLQTWKRFWTKCREFHDPPSKIWQTLSWATSRATRDPNFTSRFNLRPDPRPSPRSRLLRHRLLRRFSINRAGKHFNNQIKTKKFFWGVIWRQSDLVNTIKKYKTQKVKQQLAQQIFRLNSVCLNYCWRMIRFCLNLFKVIQRKMFCVHNHLSISVILATLTIFELWTFNVKLFELFTKCF